MSLDNRLSNFAKDGDTKKVIEYIKNLDTYLTDKEENYQYKQESFNVALIWAITYNRLETIKTIIDMGADINRPGERNHLPICTAAREGKLEAVQLLLSSGADPFFKDCHNKNAYEHAKFKKHLEVQDFLLEYMNNIKKANKNAARDATHP